jgi:hypothetical protein
MEFPSMKIWRRRILLAVAMLLPSVLAAQPAKLDLLVPERLPVDDVSPAWTGAQIVSADRTGHVFFFRGDTFEVYPIAKSGSFGEPVPLETTTAPNQMVHDAVLSPGGDRWLVYADLSVRLFVAGKEKAVPPIPWKPWSVTLRRDTPVVAVLPMPMGGRGVDLEKMGTPPSFLEFDGDRWNSALEMKGVSVSDVVRQGAKLNDVVAERSVYMMSDRQGRLWAAGQYRYRLQRFLPGFRPNLEVLVGHGEVRRKKGAESKGIEIKRQDPGQNPAEATRDPLKEKSTYTPFSGESVVLDLTEGREGRIYLLVRTEGGGAALDRFDPALLLLERLPLELKVEGRYSIASGRDGLYIAAWNGRQGRWRLPWEALDQAKWKDVADCEIDGVPMAESHSSRPAVTKP